MADPFIKPTVFDLPDAPISYYSYTLPNTPFYLKIDYQGFDNLINNYQILWNLGDGTTLIGPSAQHFYKFPGSYTVTATVYDRNGAAYNLAPVKLSAFNAMPDKILFKNLSDSENYVYTLKAGKRSSPLEILRYNSWQNDNILKKNNYTINLYASGSKSDYFSPKSYYSNKWSHLRQYFGFVSIELDDNSFIKSRLINSTSTTSVSVYAIKDRFPSFGKNYNIQLNFTTVPGENTAFVGTTGTTFTERKSIHFIDQTPSDISNDSIVFVFATPDTRGYADKLGIEYNLFNNVAEPPYGYINYQPAVQPVKSLFNPAEKISISSNGITTEGLPTFLGPVTAQELFSFNIYPIKWTNTKIPFVLTLKDAENFTTKCYPPITGYSQTNDEQTLNSVKIKLFKYVDLDPFTPGLQLSAVEVDDYKITKNEKAPLLINSGGYFCGLLEVSKQTPLCFLSAAALIKDEPAVRNNYATGFLTQFNQPNLKKYSKRPIYSNCSDKLELTYTATNETYAVTGKSNFAVSVAPLNTQNIDKKSNVWVTNPDDDTLSVFDTDGNLFFYFTLSAISFYNGDFTLPVIRNLKGDLNSSAPSYIAIDGQGDAWITLSDSVMAIKINRDTFLVTASAIPSLENIEYVDSNLYTILSAQLSGFVGENSLIPTCADVDINNNLWVGYSHPVSGFIMKYGTNGALLSVFPVSPAFSIQEIIISKNNDIWASFVNLNDRDKDLDFRNDFVYLWDENFSLKPNFPVTGIPGIGSMTIDLNQNLWVNCNRNSLIKINTLGIKNTVVIGSNTNNTPYIQSFGAIAADTENFIWLVDNFKGKLWLYNPVSNLPENSIIPLSSIPSGDLVNISIMVSGMPAFYNTVGDWTGIRWINKYLNPINPTNRYVYGYSNTFDILSSTFFINKVNENFDLASTYKSYLLQESLFDSTNLWDNFIGQIVGDYSSPPTSFGKKVYEKISNFVDNNSNPDTCNIDSLKSLFSQYGLNFSSFAVEYPPDLKRAIDLLSVNQGKLFGSPNKYNRNFYNFYDNTKGPNLGEEINIDTGKFILGEPIVAYELFSEKFTLITNTLILTSVDSYGSYGNEWPLSGVNYYWGWGLVTGNKSQSGAEIKPYYKFYRYNDYRPDDIKDSLIDFNNPLTTILPTNSGYSDWIKYGGLVDKILGYTLYKGLELINE